MSVRMLGDWLFMVTSDSVNLATSSGGAFGERAAALQAQKRSIANLVEEAVVGELDRAVLDLGLIGLAIMFVLMLVLAQSDDQKQVLAAVFLAATTTAHTPLSSVLGGGMRCAPQGLPEWIACPDGVHTEGCGPTTNACA